MDLHCTFCGTTFSEQVNWPRHCVGCDRISYKNPIPVVVAIIPIVAGGWLIVQRAEEHDPQKGKWALPGGYVDFGETWQQAIVRELMEEVNLKTSESDFQLLEVVNSANGNMIIFCVHPGVHTLEVQFVPNKEVSAIAITDHADLCFPTHNAAWGRAKATRFDRAREAREASHHGE